ncbi:MAG: hypothetical protein ACI9Y7_002938 [Dokdonia sp.]|jgi:hypothetical protein
MKTTKLLILICVISFNTVFTQGNRVNDPNFSPLENRYFDQKPLSLIPELFAPGYYHIREF